LTIRLAKDLNLLEPPKFNSELNSKLSPLQQEDLRKRIKSIEAEKANLDLKVQEELIKVLEEDIGVTKHIQELPVAYNLFSTLVKEMYQKLVQIGIVPQMKLNMKKNAFE
jgi:hypothetical protein